MEKSVKAIVQRVYNKNHDGVKYKILVSACLLGEPVRYDGKIVPCEHPLLSRWQDEGRLIPFCPEVVGGLPIPRPPAEIIGGDGHDVLNKRATIETKAGRDVTQAFIAGADAALQRAKASRCRMAILTEKSPSCGRHMVYNGTFSAVRVPGMGVTAALLEKNGIPVFSQLDLDALLNCASNA